MPADDIHHLFVRMAVPGAHPYPSSPMPDEHHIPAMCSMSFDVLEGRVGLRQRNCSFFCSMSEKGIKMFAIKKLVENSAHF